MADGLLAQLQQRPGLAFGLAAAVFVLVAGGGFLYAQLLAHAEQLEGAELVLRDLIRKHPKQNAFYKLLADVRVRGGHRLQVGVGGVAFPRRHGGLDGTSVVRGGGIR